jgi:hypothetical protein
VSIGLHRNQDKKGTETDRWDIIKMEGGMVKQMDRGKRSIELYDIAEKTG